MTKGYDYDTAWEIHRKLVLYKRWLLENKLHIVQSTVPQRRPFITNKLDGQIYDVMVMLKELERFMKIEFEGNIENLIINTKSAYLYNNELRLL